MILGRCYDIFFRGVKIVVVFPDCYDFHYYSNVAIIDGINSKLIVLVSVGGY